MTCPWKVSAVLQGPQRSVPLAPSAQRRGAGNPVQFPWGRCWYKLPSSDTSTSSEVLQERAQGSAPERPGLMFLKNCDLIKSLNSLGLFAYLQNGGTHLPRREEVGGRRQRWGAGQRLGRQESALG